MEYLTRWWTKKEKLKKPFLYIFYYTHTSLVHIYRSPRLLWCLACMGQMQLIQQIALICLLINHILLTLDLLMRRRQKQRGLKDSRCCRVAKWVRADPRIIIEMADKEMIWSHVITDLARADRPNNADLKACFIIRKMIRIIRQF